MSVPSIFYIENESRIVSYLELYLIVYQNPILHHFRFKSVLQHSNIIITNSFSRIFASGGNAPYTSYKGYTHKHL